MTFRRWLLLALLVVLLLAFAYRDQLYLRDLRAHVTRNGVEEAGAQIFFNLSSDVLLENDNAPMYLLLIQHDRPIRSPAQINCLHFLLCFIPNDNATLFSSDRGAGSEPSARIKSMTADAVEFRDPEGRDAVVTFH